MPFKTSTYGWQMSAKYSSFVCLAINRILDSNDISHKDRFLEQLTYMQENPNLYIIKSLFSYFPDTPEVEASERYQQYKAVKEKEHNAINTTELIAKELPRWSCVIHTTYFAKTEPIKNTK